MGLMGQVNALGQQFCAEDLQTLLRDGHELGSHTFGHLSCRSTSLAGFEADVLKGKRAVEQLTGGNQPHTFSYPFGHVTWRAKKSIGALVTSCRGIMPGINESVVDLNLLQANSLYSRSFDPDAIDRLLQLNNRRHGWLLFYTHDIADGPSAFGCRRAEFEIAVKMACQSGAHILPVGQAAADCSVSHQ
jgi:peptidoglycan/xylan/chitin deacetylase (PgdA/CDA1 family)